MAVLQLWLSGLALLLVVQTLLWLLSLALGDSSIVDIFWGPLFILANALYLWQGAGLSPRSLLLTGLVVLWGLRLAGHILLRNWGRGEDFRYRAWREQHGPRYGWISLFQVFLLQGSIAWLVSLPLAVVHATPEPMAWGRWDLLALLVWAVGFYFEAVGDRQLRRFKADPANRGQVMDRGLWRYTRHPNYFGDALVWWGFGLFALASPTHWWALTGPLLMTWLLLRVSGVALLERNLDRRPAYQAYMARTSPFIPWPPRPVREDRPE